MNEQGTMILIGQLTKRAKKEISERTGQDYETLSGMIGTVGKNIDRSEMVNGGEIYTLAETSNKLKCIITEMINSQSPDERIAKMYDALSLSSCLSLALNQNDCNRNHEIVFNVNLVDVAIPSIDENKE